MSTADDTWQEWEAEHYGARGANAETQRLFKSAYRRALEDAADACKKWRHDPDASEFIERELRGRAAEVGTKDGADEIEVPCLSCNDDPNVDCPVGCGRR